ncbi:uncharacterized protein EKO05_0010148 [Ascochyta rabiei]|uniref:uncharacterized protein n=1 Tax=Didymella rabiei TaxID=5454 RepID=UPI0019025DCB|nr:uncharacterized protein EKO05_0010148 [Ascochyta rabiei]UPX19898.1 hypothetical protein EKO05_0010148 [Ascochyta rabiei]
MTSYLFRIDEVREDPETNPSVDATGHWVPSYKPNANIVVNEGTSGIWWYCNGNQIYAVRAEHLPLGRKHYKTYSVFFSGGYGFRILRGNATNPRPDEAYRPLGFEHHDMDGYSSSVTNVLQGTTLRCHRADQLWVAKLLPNTYHGPVATTPGQGGLKGELPIFLALLALSMPAANLRTCLPQMFVNGAWQTHSLPHGWVDKRGVIVSVYAVPVQGGGTNAQAIANLEQGPGRRYYA